nr:unnamed protein product [Spirometra erinaceieuropaei]
MTVITPALSPWLTPPNLPAACVGISFETPTACHVVILFADARAFSLHPHPPKRVAFTASLSFMCPNWCETMRWKRACERDETKNPDVLPVSYAGVCLSIARFAPTATSNCATIV